MTGFPIDSVARFEEHEGAVLYDTLVFAVSFCIFTVAFICSWKGWPRCSARFRAMDRSQKADFCSRWNSSLHCAVVVPGYIWCLLSEEWTSEMQALGSSQLCRTFFAFSVAYFLFDLGVVIYYKVPMFPVFIFHHITAILPYAVNIWAVGCYHATFVLAAFLLVEIAVIPLNAQVFLDNLGYDDTIWFIICFYVTYVAWLITRVFWPVFLLYLAYTHVVPVWGSNACVIPSIICAHLITLFCIIVFVFFLTHDLIQRWKAPAGEGAGGDKFVELGDVEGGAGTSPAVTDGDAPGAGAGGTAAAGPATAGAVAAATLPGVPDDEPRRASTTSAASTTRGRRASTVTLRTRGRRRSTIIRF